MKQYDMAIQDCKRALEIDNTIVKGHFFHGQALLELNLFDEAITSLARGKFCEKHVCYIKKKM